MTSASSVTPQALVLQQQEQLRQGATTKAWDSTSAYAAATTVDTARRPQVGAALSSALSQLGSNEADTTRPSDQRLTQALKSYDDLGPSQETDG